MARDESEIDQETFQRVLAEETAKGTDKRIAEGRARSAAIKAFRKAHGIEPKPPRPAGEVPAAAAAAAAGNGGGDGAGGDGARAPVPAGVGAAATAGPTALRTAPAPTGRPPTAKPGTPEKQRLLALVQP